jgi:alpha-galactosidase
MQGRCLRYVADSLSPLSETQSALLFDAWSFDDLFDLCGLRGAHRDAFSEPKNLYVQCGGWQSWSCGWELASGETLPRRVKLIPDLIKLTNRYGDTSMHRDELAGHFIMYIRAGDTYLCIASKEGGMLPPVTYRINRKKRHILAEVYCAGKYWKKGETLAELNVFATEGYFQFKDALKAVYAPYSALNSAPQDIGGYESWYNHYTDIDEKLILQDLNALGTTDNIIKLRYIDRGKPVVFQIDDGWEKAVGEWEVNTARFPHGLASIARKIEDSGFIPGLWLAPFLVTKKARVFREYPEWLLKSSSGKPVVAGFNPLWDNRYFCLDLSRADVLEYLDSLAETVINGWGFRYLKLDFMYAGLLAGGFANGGSPYEHYEKACGILTKRTMSASGKQVTYLGCGIPFGPSYRHFPFSRIGTDTRETWDWALARLIGHIGRPGAFPNMLDTIGRAYLNGTVYRSDPDVVFTRTKNCKLTANEKELVVLIAFMFGSQIMFSDDSAALTAEDIAFTQRIAARLDALDGDEYGAVRIGRNLFRLESRSGKISGVIDLQRRIIRL